ncbi:thiocillin family RiPP [Staphylococcus pseudintermedius]|uniref:thiocillin family RiPP n=1 Tax=Staphylococcus pseudintermedius TaxID=283734 RepID=UPI000D72F084|nr:thiocillin family RiPP [Staphylococcus pseudintermedius]EGQ1665013.1 thiocillin family RiPP [Staphylococcus pseudintermedius]EGQ1788991.1 thiocillin family RiPP [Staphylococcus pseudintermedius]EGQ2810853.1 thiocillin family RiPP [Staphylococcus pseudintermedius]EGQ3052385.1 thiocillin family RiPP [Staphylococcus pseudintermedius]EGQ3795884.1 thiocillin family RiPP [Staphylococcus pseudintermedius]
MNENKGIEIDLQNLVLEEEEEELEVAASLATLSTFGTATGCASSLGTVSCFG